jgi:hypothetical protein
LPAGLAWVPVWALEVLELQWWLVVLEAALV